MEILTQKAQIPFLDSEKRWLIIFLLLFLASCQTKDQTGNYSGRPPTSQFIPEYCNDDIANDLVHTMACALGLPDDLTGELLFPPETNISRVELVESSNGPIEMYFQNNSNFSQEYFLSFLNGIDLNKALEIIRNRDIFPAVVGRREIIFDEISKRVDQQILVYTQQSQNYDSFNFGTNFTAGTSRSLDPNAPTWTIIDFLQLQIRDYTHFGFTNENDNIKFAFLSAFFTELCQGQVIPGSVDENRNYNPDDFIRTEIYCNSLGFALAAGAMQIPYEDYAMGLSQMYYPEATGQQIPFEAVNLQQYDYLQQLLVAQR